MALGEGPFVQNGLKIFKHQEQKKVHNYANHITFSQLIKSLKWKAANCSNKGN